MCKTDPNVEANWAFIVSAAKSSRTVSGLTSGTEIWLRVRAIGAKDSAGAYSDPATKEVP